MMVSPTVDFHEIASKTEGFSGADLQALLYNAHLDVIHSSISEIPTISSSSQNDNTPIQYAIIGGSPGQEVLSKAEETALQKRVCICQTVIYLPYNLCAAASSDSREVTLDKK